MSVFMRGTTPTHTFHTSIDLTGAVVLFITYKQLYNTVLEKDISDCEITSDSVTVHLTQAETLMFQANLDVEIQIRARFADGTAVGCDILVSDVHRILKDGVI